MIYYANIALFGFKSLDLTGSYSNVLPRLRSKTVWQSVTESDFVYSDDNRIYGGHEYKRQWVKDRWGFHEVLSV